MTIRKFCLIFLTAVTVLIVIDADSGNLARRTCTNRLLNEKKYLYEFLNFTGQILKKRDPVDRLVDDWLGYFRDDLRNAYAVGTKFLGRMEEYNKNNETALKESEKQSIQDQFKDLVTRYTRLDSFAIWVGENQGGAISAAIYKAVGGDPVAILGNKTEDNFLAQINFPQ